MRHLRIHPESHEPPTMDRLVAADCILGDLEAAMRIIGGFFCARLDMERGLTFEELFDLDCTLDLAFRAARNRLDAIFVAERAAGRLPTLKDLEEKLPGLRKDPEGGES